MKNILYTILLVSISNISSSIYAQNCQKTPFAEKNGLVVVEVESIPLENGWKSETSAKGFTGSTYYRWDGGNKLSDPGSGLLEYKIYIHTPGVYRFQMHMKVGSGSSTSDSNDSWLKIPDADDFYGEHNNGSIVHPHGVCINDCPNGRGKDGWFKMYSAGTTDWTWKTLTNDKSGYKIYANFSKAGTYTVLLSGRSEDHLIDRFVMYNSSVTEKNATDLNNNETLCESTTNLEIEQPFRITNVYPNPGKGYYNVVIQANQSNDYRLEVHNLIGQKVYSETWIQPFSEHKKALDLSRLDDGLYILSINSNGRKTSKIIIKEAAF